MIRYSTFRADIKQIVREPVLVLFMLLPFLIGIIFKLLVVSGFPVLLKMTGFDLYPYKGYVLVTALLMTPGMIGTVTGFLMIDERDSRIYELMSVTPMGFSGYIAHRLILPFSAGMIYTIMVYFLLDLYPLGVWMLLYIAVLMGLEGIMISLLLFKLADNKVKGLTYSKGLTALFFFAFTDLLKTEWVKIIAVLCPFYWISRMVHHPEGMVTVLLAGIVHLLWLGMVVTMSRQG